VKITDKNQSVDITLNTTSENDASDKIFTLPEMAEISAGSFLMGDPSPNAKAPQRKAAVETNYYMSKYEITFNEYDYFAIATNRRLPDDNGWGRGKRPVINVSWDDANAYTDWLSKVTEQRYRLPTDIEWEYAARANTNSLYWWGDNKDDAIKNANCRFGCRSFFANVIGNKTQPVGTFSFNNFGLYDTAGNVAEWVEDCYENTKNVETKDVDEDECQHRIIRGGSFRDTVKNIASHSKNYLSPTDYNDSTGFRIMKESGPQNRTERKPEKAPRKNLFQRIIQKFK
jgi:serine/threonine-protein kinase PpkA